MKAADRNRLTSIERKLLVLWIVVGAIVWNGVYDMVMHDEVRGYLLDSALSGRPGSIDIRVAMHRAVWHAATVSTAWALLVFAAGLVTMRAGRSRTGPADPALQ